MKAVSQSRPATAELREPPARHPLVYEINTRCWLRELSERRGATATLTDAPETELAAWRRLGFTHIWLMGVWRTGPRGREFSRRHPEVRASAARLLPDAGGEDFVASPYAIAGYEVTAEYGGEAGLKHFRARLAAHGLRLLLDFIPNHVGLDHPWLAARPELFVQSKRPAPEAFLQTTPTGPRWLAHGKDPHFHAWMDTAQLDYRNAATRAAMLAELQSVARRCDGVRCDMAMLVLNEVFAKTWGKFSPTSIPPDTEFWAEAIRASKREQPDFLFLGEVYWALEQRLQSLGFDFTYDKEFYDELIFRHGAGISQRLRERSHERLARDTRFLENHDEPRVAALLSPDEHRAAALLTLGLPGMRLLHEGQLTGARLRASVHLARRPVEVPSPEIAAFYERLLMALPATAVGRGEFALLSPRPAWEGNPSHENFVLAQWQSNPEQFDLVVVNLAPHPSQSYATLNVPNLAEHAWRMKNLLGVESFLRRGDELARSGLYLDVPAHGAQLFQFTRDAQD